MRLTPTLTRLATVGLLGAAAVAQDSVSKLNGLPGDAVDPRVAGEQQNDYVVDQTIVRSSWGTVFGLAPLVKSGLERNTAPGFYNALINAQAISKDLKSGVPFVRSSYSLWTTPGAGVNDDVARNDPGAPQNTAGLQGYQFAAGMTEFSTGTTSPTGSNAGLNNVTSAVVNFTDARPSRLYVSRVQSAVNGPAENCNLAATHMGVIDADGNHYFRADGFGAAPACGGFSAISGNNQFRVRALARNAATVNVINLAGGADAGATDWLLPLSATTYTTPNGIPSSLAGRPILIGSNFNNEYAFEQVAGSLVTTSLVISGAVGTRGSVGYTPNNFATLFAGTVNGTAGILARTVAGSNVPTDRILLWGLDANGGISASTAVVLPAAITDPDQPAWPPAGMPGLQEFDHYHSQTAFQGGTSAVALGRDQAGNLLVAGCVYYNLTSSMPPNLDNHLTALDNYIAVAKIDPAGTTTWSVAGWTVGSTDGKAIYDGSMAVIGRMGGSTNGPQISAPMIDSVGNVWFVGDVTLFGAPDVQTAGLLRAVYQPATFSYKLELVLSVGDVLAGRNSGRNYLISFLPIRDNDSVSSGTAYSGNVSAAAFKNQSTAGMSTSDSRTLGGLVVSAQLLYDNNNDGMYVDGTGNPPPPASPDEDYAVLLYLTSSVDDNMNDIPDDAEIPGNSFCFGDNLDPNVTTDCPCMNFGAPGRGCANSVNANGALLLATGTPNPDTIVLAGSGMPATVSCIYLQGDALADIVFGDGVRCAGGQLIRLRTKQNVGGASTFPDSADTVSVSQRGMVMPGSGLTRYYQTYYRNAAAAFCPPATFNVTNGHVIVW